LVFIPQIVRADFNVLYSCFLGKSVHVLELKRLYVPESAQKKHENLATGTKTSG
jgi:hypothetical protein